MLEASAERWEVGQLWSAVQVEFSAPGRLSDGAVQGRMVPLLSRCGRPQMWLSRFPRFESTARVVTKAGPGGTNEVMFWSLSRIDRGKAQRRSEPRQLGRYAAANGKAGWASQETEGGEEKRLREAIKIPENGKSGRS